MIVLGGYSRYPIFYSDNGKKVIGSKSENVEMNTYVNSLSGEFIVLHTIADLDFKSRFIVKNLSINPQLKNTREEVPKTIFIFPDLEPEPTLNNVYAKGFALKGGRNPVFVPLLSLRELTQKEAEILLDVAKISAITFEKIKFFLNGLDIQYEIEKELAENRVVLRIADPYINDTYRILINKNLQILDVDFCLSEYEGFFLTELIFSVRENGSIYHTTDFNY